MLVDWLVYLLVLACVVQVQPCRFTMIAPRVPEPILGNGGRVVPTAFWWRSIPAVNVTSF